MTITNQIAKHLREVYFGGNWSTSNLRDNLSDVSWEQATTKVHGLNTIASLTFHVNYYVHEVSKVLNGEPLKASDKYCFTHPPIASQGDWEKMLEQTWEDGKHFADLIEKMPEEKLLEDFADPKYGVYYRNLHGIIEHIHYHLGQIAVIKKIISGS